MNKEQVITLLDQVHGVSEATSNILGVAKELPASEGAPLITAVRHLLTACDILNQIGADNEQGGETGNTLVPKDAVTW